MAQATRRPRQQRVPGGAAGGETQHEKQYGKPLLPKKRVGSKAGRMWGL